MSRARLKTPEDICGFCDEYATETAEPAYRDIGMGRCQVQAENPPLSKHVAWDAAPCVSFRLDRPNIAARRQYVQVQRDSETQKADSATRKS